MSELEGDEYAAARAMIDGNRANIEDIKGIMDSYEKNEDEVIRKYIRTFLFLIGDKNPEKLKQIRRDKPMGEKWMQIFKPEIDDHDKQQLFIYVQDGAMSIEYAAGRAILMGRFKTVQTRLFDAYDSKANL